MEGTLSCGVVILTLIDTEVGAGDTGRGTVRGDGIGIYRTDSSLLVDSKDGTVEMSLAAVTLTASSSSASIAILDTPLTLDAVLDSELDALVDIVKGVGPLDGEDTNSSGWNICLGDGVREEIVSVIGVSLAILLSGDTLGRINDVSKLPSIPSCNAALCILGVGCSADESNDTSVSEGH